MNKVKLIANENEERFQQDVNEFILGKQIISIQYATTPTAIAAHSEYGVYPCVQYSVLIHYKE